jgi:hypothetical protein
LPERGGHTANRPIAQPLHAPVAVSHVCPSAQHTHAPALEQQTSRPASQKRHWPPTTGQQEHRPGLKHGPQKEPAPQQVAAEPPAAQSDVPAAHVLATGTHAPFSRVKPGLQVKPHAPWAQVGVALATAGQRFPQAPQLRTSLR